MSSEMQTWRWDMVTTNLDWFTFGVARFTNFAPINDDVLFFGSTDTADSGYFLVGYNFSDPSNLVWRKSISWVTTGWFTKVSASILSLDEKSIFTMILYDDNFLFYKLNVTDGNPLIPGFILNDSGYQSSFSMREFTNLIAVQIDTIGISNYKRLILFSNGGTQVLEDHKSVNSREYSVGRLTIGDKELMYHWGRYTTGNTFFFARTTTENIDQLSEFAHGNPIFTPITTNYQISSTTSNPSLSSSSKTLTISSSTSITLTDITSSVTPSYSTYVALWNELHAETVQGNSSVKLNFTWAWYQAINSTIISFTLVKTGAYNIPEWVEMDADMRNLSLVQTPRLEQDTKFYFSVEISFSSQLHYKEFEITVEKCTILNCRLWQLGNTNLWETWDTEFQSSGDKTSCSKPTEDSETTQVSSASGSAKIATGMVVASVAIVTLSSILSLASINSLFSMLNNLQLAILLPLVPDYLSEKVLDFLSKMGFSMLSFDFIRLKDIPFVEDITKWVAYPQSDQYLNNLGMRSGSSVVNYLSLLAFIIFLAIIHIGIIIWKKSMHHSKRRKWKKFASAAFRFFTFNIYIRIFMQAFLFTTLSICSELYAFNLNTVITTISFGLWIMFALSSSVLFFVSFWMYKRSLPQLDIKEYWSCTEYFNGIRPGKYTNLYSSLFMTLRLMLAVFLIFGESSGALIRSIYFSILNIWYWAYLIIVRPFENQQDNIVEVINQVLFCCLSVPLIWVNTKPNWTSFYEDYYITILMLSPSCGGIISLIYLVKSIFICIRRNKARNMVQSLSKKKPISKASDKVKNKTERKSKPLQSQSVVKLNSSFSHSNVNIMDPSQEQAEANLRKQTETNLKS